MPAIAALGDIVIAFAALLLLYAAYQLFHNFLFALVARIPLIGGELARLTDVILFDMERGAAQWARDSVKTLVSIILTPIHWVESLINGIYGAIQSLYGAVSILRYVTIPTLINGVLSTAHTWFSQSLSYAGTLFAQAQAYSLSLFNRAITFTQTEVAQAEDYTARLYQAETLYVDHEIQVTQQYAGALFNSAITYTSKGLTDLENWTAAGLGALGTTLTGDITALSKWITAEIPMVTSYVDARVGAVEADLGRLKAECTDNLCNNLGSLANLFNLLTSAWTVAGFVALIGEALHDPHGVAGELDKVVGAPMRAVASTVTGQAAG